jgi:hypothetical protein
MTTTGPLNYYDMKRFCELTTNGKLTPMHQVELPNISGDHIYKIPYHNHLVYLCQKYDENILSLCSTLMNHINQENVSRLEQSPIFREKIIGVINENNFENDVQCSDIFPIHSETFDYGTYLKEKSDHQSLFTDIESLNEMSDDEDLYDNLTSLIESCDNCSSSINTNIDQLKKTTHLYQPKYGSILLDLGTRHKPFYMEGFMKDPKDTRIIRRVNKEVSQRIPDNIETIMMNVGLWLPQCISRESRRVQLDYRTMLDSLSEKKSQLSNMKQRLPDPHVKSFPQTNFLQNLVQSLMSGDTSDEEEDYEDGGEEPVHQSKNLKMMEIEDQLKEAISSDKKEETSDKLYELSLKKNNKPHFYSSGEEDEDDDDEDDDDDDDEDLN